MPTQPTPVRRIITGINAEGRSYFEEDGPAHLRQTSSRPGLYSQHVWGTGPIPVPVDDSDRSDEAPGIMPPAGGSILHVIDYPPEPKDPAERDKAYDAMRTRIREAGVNPEPGQRRLPDEPHPGMHETDTIDYAIVMSGEIWAIMDAGETLMKTGDVLMQRGTAHAWSNRSDDYCRVAFVLVEATPLAGG